MSELADSINELKIVYNKEISFLKERISHQKEALDFMADKAIEARKVTLGMAPAEAGHYLKAHNLDMIKRYDTHLAESIGHIQNIIRNKMGVPIKTDSPLNPKTKGTK